jgi:hypothetical protein
MRWEVGCLDRRAVLKFRAMLPGAATAYRPHYGLLSPRVNISYLFKIILVQPDAAAACPIKLPSKCVAALFGDPKKPAGL